MKNCFSLLILLLILGCKSTVKSESKPISITPTEVQNMVAYLASDELEGRATGSRGIEKSAQFIEAQLKAFKIKPYFNSYRDIFKVGEQEAFNLVGIVPGSDATLKNEFVIIGAHYDHIGFRAKKVENDSIANGANDNAAGTSAVLSIAKYFGANKSNKRSLMIVLFSAEEMGLLGSKHLANKLKSQNLDIYTMLNFEMIGVPFKNRDYKAFVTGYDISNIGPKMNDYSGSNLIGFSEVAKNYNLFKASDNYPFYNTFNVPAHTVSSCDLSNYNQYHKVGDEASLMDYKHMASLINNSIPIIEKICNTPTREIRLTNE